MTERNSASTWRTWWLLALVACGDKAGDTGTSVVGEADISSSVYEVDLGAVPRSGWGVMTATVVLRNVGSADLELSSVALDGGLSFALEGEPSKLTVPPEQTSLIVVVFDPVEPGVHEDTLRVLSNDPDTPELTVSLRGEAMAGVLEPSPSQLDFDGTLVGCPDSRELHLSNEGADTLTLEKVAAVGAPRGVEVDLGELELPLVMEVGDRVSLVVHYEPDGVTDTGGVVRATISGAAETTVDVPLVGETPTGPGHQQSWAVPFHSTADVLLALDRSSSMATPAYNLTYETDSLLAPLQAAGLDLHVAWTVEDTGCINGAEPWLDGATPLEEADALAYAMVKPGQLDHDEARMAFAMLTTTLEASAPGGCSEDLARTEATWHLVGLSDRDEESPGRWEDWLAGMEAMAGPEELVYMHGVGGDEAGSCSRATAYEGVLDAVEATGGSFHLVCDPAADVMAALGSEIVARHDAMVLDARTLELEATGDGGQITVTIDGSETEAWSFEAEANVVLLDEAPPEGGVVELGFFEQETCPE